MALTSWMHKDSTQTQVLLVDDFVIDSVHSHNSNPEGKWASSVIDRAIIGAVRSHYCTSPSVIVYIDLETPAGSVFLSASSVLTLFSAALALNGTLAGQVATTTFSFVTGCC